MKIKNIWNHHLVLVGRCTSKVGVSCANSTKKIVSSRLATAFFTSSVERVEGLLGVQFLSRFKGGNQWRTTTKMIEITCPYSMNVNVYQSLSHCLGVLLHVLCSCKYSNRVFVSTCEPAKGKQENPISVYWLKGSDSKNGWFQNPCKQG